MIRREEVQKLAELSLLAVDDAELDKITREIDSVLEYVSELSRFEVKADRSSVPALRNVMRDDGEPHATGLYSDKILNEMPQKSGNWLRVKKIL